MENKDDFNTMSTENSNYKYANQSKDSKEVLSSILKHNEYLIHELNNNFKIILSYGTGNELIPAGQFEISNIIAGDELDPTQKIVFTQIDDPSVELIMPRTRLKEFIEKAYNNFNRFKNDDYIYNFGETSLLMEELATNSLLESEEGLKGVEVIPIQDTDIILLQNGKDITWNCSICPIVNDYYKTKVLERLPDYKSEKKEDDSINTVRRKYRITEIDENNNAKKEKSTPYNSDPTKESSPKFIPTKEDDSEEKEIIKIGDPEIIKIGDPEIIKIGDPEEGPEIIM